LNNIRVTYPEYFVNHNENKYRACFAYSAASGRAKNCRKWWLTRTAILDKINCLNWNMDKSLSEARYTTAFAGERRAGAKARRTAGSNAEYRGRGGNFSCLID
jgi:hypothetical protein